MQVAAIVAMDESSAIGKDNALPWHISDDLRLFKKITLGHAILMGHNTYRSMGKALPGRTNIVLSRDENLKLSDAVVLHSKEEVMEYCRSNEIENLFIIGGAQIFKLWEENYDRLYVSRVNTVISGADVYFPLIDWDDYKSVYQRFYPANKRNEFSFYFRISDR